MPRLPTKLECPAGEVDPGGDVLACELRVYNAADRVDEVGVTPQGPLATWVTVTPATLALLPETEGHVDVTLALAADAPVEAGTHHLLLEVRSGLADVEPSLEELDVEVARRTEASLTLHVVDRPGEDSVVEARLRSGSNHHLRVHLHATAPVGVAVDPPVIDVPPFTAASALVTPALGPDLTAPVELTVRASGDGVDSTERILLAPSLAEPPTEPAVPVVDVPPPAPPVEEEAAPSEAAPSEARRALALLLVLLVAAVALAAVLTWDPLAEDGPPDFDVGAFPELQLREPRLVRDDWEATWQLMLQRRDFDLGADGVDGRFGPVTEAATVAFQAEEGLDRDGTVDADDWTRMLTHYWQREDPDALAGWRPEAASPVRAAW